MQHISERLGGFLMTSLELLAALFILVLGALALWAVVAYILDVTQTRHAIRRNYQAYCAKGLIGWLAGPGGMGASTHPTQPGGRAFGRGG